MMKRLIALVLTVLLCCSFALAEVTLTVQGTAAITAAPDVVTVSANACVIDASAMSAQVRISEMIGAMRTALLELGLTEDDIVTQNYSFYPQYDYADGAEKLIGYQANHTVDITCRDLEKLNEVLTAVTESGVSQVYSITYGVSTRNEIYRQALCDAIKVAREKAELMAASCGYTTLTMTSVEENAGTFGAVMYANALRDEASASKALATGINAGSISVSASVQVVFTAE